MNKAKRFLANRVENFKRASSFGKVWRIAGYGVLALVLLGILLPAPSEEQTEPVAQEPAAQENPTSEEWRQDQVKAAQEQAAKEEAAQEQAAEEEAASKGTPKQEIEESLKDSLGDQYRASEITKRPDGYYVFVKFDAADNITNGMIRDGIFIDAEDAIESLDEDVVGASFNAYLPAADGGDDLFVLGAERLEADDGDADRMEHWEIGMIHPDLQ
jgi:ribosomal protein S6